MPYRKPDEDGRSAVEAVADTLRAAIGDGTLVPGQRLVAAEWANRLDAGGNSLREALRVLAGEGLLTLEAHRGATVRRLDSDELAEIWEMREAMEGMAARLAARRVASGEGAEDLRRTLAESAATARADDPAAYYAANAAFHAEVLALSGRARLAEAARRLLLPVNRRLFAGLIRREAIRASHSGHVAIARAIRGGEEDAAEALMRAHIREAAARLG